MRANEFLNELAEARRNNFGREISNVQGQALGKKLAAGDPRAQQALAQAKAAQQTNVGDMYGKGMDTLGITPPQQRLAAKKAAAAKYGDMAVDPDEVRTSQQPTSNWLPSRPPLNNNPPDIQPTTQQPQAQPQANAAPTKAAPKGTVKTSQNPIDRALKPASDAYNAVAQVGNTISQSQLGQKLGGWSQRALGIGNVTAAGQQIWMNKYMSIVNNMIKNANNSQVKFDFSRAIDQYMAQQNLKLDPAQQNQIKRFAKQVQARGFKREDIVSLGNTLWNTSLTAAKNAPADVSAEKPADAPVDKKPAQKQPTDKTSAGAGAFNNMANQLSGDPASNQGSNAFNNMANQLGSATQPAQADTGSAYGQGTQPASTPAAPVKPPQKTVPVGTKFAVPTKNGDTFIAQKTDTGWKVGGTMITDPKKVATLEKQATQAITKPKARVAKGATTRAPVAKPVDAKPKLKAPSALAKGTPGKPAVAGKSRIR